MLRNSWFRDEGKIWAYKSPRWVIKRSANPVGYIHRSEGLVCRYPGGAATKPVWIGDPNCRVEHLNLHLGLLRIILLSLYDHFLWIHVIQLLISFRVVSLALGKLYFCASVSEVTLKDMGKISPYKTTTKHNTATSVCIIHGRTSHDSNTV